MGQQVKLFLHIFPFLYLSDSDIEGEFPVEFLTPEHPCYIKNLLDRLSKLTEGILMVNSSLVNVLLIVTTWNFHSIYTGSPSSMSLLTPEPLMYVRVLGENMRFLW